MDFSSLRGFVFGGTVLISILVPGPAGLAQMPSLVKDINTTQDTGNADPSGFTQIGNRIYFAATDPNFGRELWATDGTSSGTVLVKDICNGCSSNPSNLTNVNGTLFFSAFDGQTPGLWKSDGTTNGTVLVKAIQAEQLTDLNGTLIFSANGLWRSDGTAAGTVMIANMPVDQLTNVNGTVFFAANGLWKSDGTATGTVKIKDTGAAQVTGLTNVNGRLFFITSGGNDDALWKSDGTPNGTVVVKHLAMDFCPAGRSCHAIGLQLVNVNGTLFVAFEVFSFPQPDFHTTQLWKSDGTIPGTSFVATEQAFLNLTNVNGTLFFVSTGTFANDDLWKSDGSPNGTFALKEIAGLEQSTQNRFTSANGTLFFTLGSGLWKSDGTSSGTILVRSGDMSSLFNANGMLLISGSFDSAFAPQPRLELLKSDGTSGGTVLVRNIGMDLSSFPQLLTDANGTLFFGAADGIHQGTGLWKSDGTAEGTVMLPAVNGFSPSLDSLDDLLNVNGTLFFPAPAANLYGLWKADGSSTSLITELPQECTASQGCQERNVNNLVNLNGTLFFFSGDSNSHPSLWKSDGTLAGTVKVVDVGDPLSSFSSFPSSLTNVNGTLMFFAGDDSGLGLWKSDGTSSGTVAIVRGLAGPGYPAIFTTANGILFFTDGQALWKSDGTTSGTVMIINPGSQFGRHFTGAATVNGTFFFTFDDRTTSTLWKSDGTTSGTVVIKQFLSGDLSILFFLRPALTSMNGMVFFSANDGVNGAELWKSDGTADGTVMVKDICPGACSSAPAFLTNINGTLFFAAGDGQSGIELWKSDGTNGGTVLAADINPGPADSSPGPFTLSGGKLFFAARDAAHGRELWSLEAPDFAMNLPESSVSIMAGQSATLHIDTKVAGGFTGTISFSCSNALPRDVSCSFAPQAVTAGNSTTLTIATMPRSSAAMHAGPSYMWVVSTSLGLLGILGCGGRHKFRSPRPLLSGVALLAVLFLAGCGGSGSRGTPAGTFRVTVTATSGSLSHSAMVTLTIN